MENIFTASKYFLIFMKFFGLFPVSFKDPLWKGIQTTGIWDTIYFIFLFGLWIFAVILNIIIGNKVIVDSALLGKVWQLLLVMIMIVIVGLLLYQMMKRKSIVEFLVTINNIDNIEVNQLELIDCLIYESFNEIIF